ncbi:carbohydrate ABC transporter permease [Saccharothrix sp. ALI-22-I]|uniref:carbohydrate ABC transporter permease n=1 Tax=Saccharothrix sp. ALI-22-I TaxID=1933778 RepID=UPI001EE6DFDE|nr:carbohydrate ABC transporter permease [Saccharothrix sp. ALI-22-I]
MLVREIRVNRRLFAAVIAVMAVPGVVLLIPKFLVLNQFGMYDSYSGMIVPLLADAAGVFIMKQFFESIPVSVEEAARIDGAGTFRTFWSVVLPMARPALITPTILSFQGSWNELPHFIVSRQSPELNTLTTGVASLASGQLGSGNQYPIKLAATLIMTIPVALVFFAFQRHFVRGGTAGAPKGEQACHGRHPCPPCTYGRHGTGSTTPTARSSTTATTTCSSSTTRTALSADLRAAA